MSGTVLNHSTLLCKRLPDHLPVPAASATAGDDGEDCRYPQQAALVYTLLKVSIDKKEYAVLYADLSSPLLTCDTFLVETAKV